MTAEVQNKAARVDCYASSVFIARIMARKRSISPTVLLGHRLGVFPLELRMFLPADTRARGAVSPADADRVR